MLNIFEQAWGFSPGLSDAVSIKSSALNSWRVMRRFFESLQAASNSDVNSTCTLTMFGTQCCFEKVSMACPLIYMWKAIHWHQHFPTRPIDLSEKSHIAPWQFHVAMQGVVGPHRCLLGPAQMLSNTHFFKYVFYWSELHVKIWSLERK